jgi:hypothetical protein
MGREIVFTLEERGSYVCDDLSRILPYCQVLEANVLKPDFADPSPKARAGAG